jgi:hypothetical protein
MLHLRQLLLNYYLFDSNKQSVTVTCLHDILKPFVFAFIFKYKKAEN